MLRSRVHENYFLFFLRWAAHVSSILCLAIIFLFFSSETISTREINATEWVGIAFFPIGTLIGLVWAWQEEGLGGSIILGSILGFYLIYGWLLNGNLWLGWALLPFLLPATLFLLYWGFFALSQVESKKEIF